MNKEHQVLIIAKNTSGIGTRILALFNRRGFNVSKMTSGVTNKPGYARLTLTVDADDTSLDQIQKQSYVAKNDEAEKIPEVKNIAKNTSINSASTPSAKMLKSRLTKKINIIGASPMRREARRFGKFII